jgi:hypothetical protein
MGILVDPTLNRGNPFGRSDYSLKRGDTLWVCSMTHYYGGIPLSTLGTVLAVRLEGTLTRRLEPSLKKGRAVNAHLGVARSAVSLDPGNKDIRHPCQQPNQRSPLTVGEPAMGPFPS